MRKIFSIAILLFSTIIFGQETKPSEDEKEDNRIYNALAIQKVPEPKEGFSEFGRYVALNFNLPAEAVKLNIQGKTFLQFIVEKDGSLTNFQIIKRLGYGLDEEAIRILSNHENWIPGEHEDKKVRVRFNLPITVKYTIQTNK